MKGSIMRTCKLTNILFHSKHKISGKAENDNSETAFGENVWQER